MNNWMIIAAIVIVFLVIVFYRGTRKVKESDKYKSLLNEKLPHVEIGTANYQGGCPNMPKPAKVTVGIANEDHLVMYDFRGNSATIDFDKVRKIEKFTTKKNPDFKGRSVIFYGPLVPLIFKPKITHFCVIGYIDTNSEENNILFESSDRRQINQIYEQVNKSWCRYERSLSCRSKYHNRRNQNQAGNCC